MEWFEALMLGIIQGLSEYLPISSSGHLEIFRQVLGVELSGADALEFDVMLHVATVLSTIVVLWREFKHLFISFVTFKMDYDFWYVCKILVSCIPVAIVGLCFKDYVESFFEGNLQTVGICLLVTAALLCFAYFFRTRPELNHSNSPLARQHDITWLDAFIIGCGQAVAVLPGLSRSGTTIATGIILGCERSKMAQFSFFMVIIPILGEALLGLKDIFSATDAGAASTVGVLPLTVGFLASFLVGCAACKWMIDIVRRGKLVWFAIYCVFMGILCILW